MADARRILVTGATGKVGQALLGRLLTATDGDLAGVSLRALCHNRLPPPAPRLEVVRGAIEEREVVERATAGVTHVVHLATSKETPDTIMDVAIKGLFWLLEACRASPTFRQLILVGGDAAVGHFVYPHPVPVTEAQRHTAYPGCYALSKVLEEVMLEQFGIQYDLGVCCLRAPWIMEKDDFRYQLSFGEDVFGGPRWRDLVGAEQADDYAARGTVPLALDAAGRPLQRNFVHVDDLVDAILAALDNPAAHAPDLQRGDGRAGRLRRARRVPGRDARTAERRDPHALPLHLAGQREGALPARLATTSRPAPPGGGGLELRARAGRSARGLVPGLTPPLRTPTATRCPGPRPRCAPAAPPAPRAAR